MTPTARVSVTLAGALVVGALVASGYGPLVSGIAQLRTLCLSDVRGQLSRGWCSPLVRYPNRLRRSGRPA